MYDGIIFKEDSINKDFHEKGFVKYGKITKEAVNALIQLYSELNIPDFYGCGYNCGMNSNLVDKRIEMQTKVNTILLPFTQLILEDFDHYTATFVDKYPRKDCFVRAHQDFSYVDEQNFPSFMCFIPLVDVSLNNAALGIIPYSHKFYEELRGFPCPLKKTAVTENDIELMSYFEIIDARAGEMIFFYQNAIHGSFSNYSKINRLALSFSLYKKGEQLYGYIYNPKTNGETLLKYAVDNNFIVNYHNPTLMDMYHIKKNIELPYPLIEEINNRNQSTSRNDILNKLKDANLKPKEDLLPLIKTYKSIKRQEKIKSSMVDFLYYFKKKFI